MTKTISSIEKCAKLMGYDDCDVQLIAGHCFVSAEGDTVKEFNPLSNKADLMDVECALGIDVMWNDGAECVSARQRTYASQDLIGIKDTQYFSSHPNKFTARANAVMAVVEQIYDRRDG